ncbi:uncharacterized protein [Oscarella lobularis]|uniref:uncharacterized protein n=1 Tax=Oscarella lobularis TaxID=121494 RepID=UPI003313C362
MDPLSQPRRAKLLERQLSLAEMKHERQRRQYLLDTIIREDGKFLTFGVNDDSCPIDLDRWRKEQNSSVEDVSRLDSNLEPLDEAFESLEDAGEEKDPSSSVVTSAPPSETEEEAKNEAGVAVGKKLRRGHRHRGSLQRLQSRMKMEDRDVADITRALADAYDLRWNYVFNEEEEEGGVNEASHSEFQVNDAGFFCQWKNGILAVGRNGDDQPRWESHSSAADFYQDLHAFNMVATHGPIRSYCWKRLQVLDAKYRLYKLEKEADEANTLKHTARDFENVAKVDTHIHHSACMSVKELFDYMKLKLKTAENEIVFTEADGKDVSLKEVFSSMNLTAESLSLDALDMKINAEDAYQRFDRFNAKYNPAGQSRLREIFLKTSNKIKGKYLAELTTNVFKRLESTAGERTEMRLSIYGRKKSEWDSLSSWVVDHNLFSERNKWMIQVPRIYTVFRKLGTIGSFFEMLDNIFTPLFECTRNPGAHPKLHKFLMQVSAFDSVDDESISEPRFSTEKTPEDWTEETNPPYSYYCFYMRANINVLNQFRAAKGLNTFKFRPHCGEAGDPSHLEIAFLLADGVAHGINLWHRPTLQYLFYLAQIGIHMSPVSNNALFLAYERNPFPKLFARGLNVSLSTDDPCQFHSTENPLLEEYSIAAKVWRLSNCDQCEVARNSVRQSGFDTQLKIRWIGQGFLTKRIQDEDCLLSNLPLIRLQFRRELRGCELEALIGEERAKKIIGNYTCSESQQFGFSHLHQELPQPAAHLSQFPLHFDEKKSVKSQVSFLLPTLMLGTGVLLGYLFRRLSY